MQAAPGSEALRTNTTAQRDQQKGALINTMPVKPGANTLKIIRTGAKYCSTDGWTLSWFNRPADKLKKKKKAYFFRRNKYGRLCVSEQPAVDAHPPPSSCRHRIINWEGGGLIMRGQAKELLVVFYTCGPPSAV